MRMKGGETISSRALLLIVLIILILLGLALYFYLSQMIVRQILFPS